MNVVKIDDNNMDELKAIIANAVIEFYELKYDDSVNINWSFELEGYSGFDGKSKDEYYDLYCLNVIIEKGSLKLRNRMSTQEFIDVFADKMGAMALDEPPYGEEVDGKLVFHICNYNDLGASKFEEAMTIINETQKKLEKFLLELEVKTANVKLEFEMHRMW